MIMVNLSLYFVMKEYCVLVIDGDFYLLNLGFYFGLDVVKYFVYIFMKNFDIDLEWVIYKYREIGVYVMFGSIQFQDVLGIFLRKFVDVIDKVCYKFGVVFVDFLMGVFFDMFLIFQLVNYQIIVVEIECFLIYFFEVMVKNEIEKFKVLGERYNFNIGVVFNKVCESEDVVDEIINVIEIDFDVFVLGWVFFDFNVFVFVNVGILIVKYMLNSDVVIVFREIGDVFEEWIFGE